MKFVPKNGYVLCSLINKKLHLVVESGISFSKEELPLYKIENCASDVSVDVNIGDVIVTNSIPTKISQLNLYLISLDYIAFKVNN